MMRVGTQRRVKSSNSSPNTTYRQSPIHNNRSSPVQRSSPNMRTSPIIHHQYHSGSPNLSKGHYNNRQSPSPVLIDTHKYAQDYHHRSVAEKRIGTTSSSPNYAERNGSSPILQRTQSPDYITSRKLNERSNKYETSASIYPNYDVNESLKVSNMKITDARRSPLMMERSKSPDIGNYASSTSRYDKRTVESKTYTTGPTNIGYDEVDDGVDTSPIIKVSSMGERAAGRRDSWDAIAKTRNILSNRSLESVANLTEQQLNEKRYSSQKYSSYDTNQYYGQQQTSSFSNLNKSSKLNGSSIGASAGGASSVRVQSIPDGVLGQPVEFESKSHIIIKPEVFKIILLLQVFRFPLILLFLCFIVW